MEMNIYEFFNSRDIAEHCRNIGYKLTAIETAYIIWHSNHHTLEEKHKAWRKIITTMPDEELPEYYWINNSLHHFLDSVINLQNEFIQDFISSKGQYVYTVSSLKRYGSPHFRTDLFFSDYDACLSSVEQSVSPNYCEVIMISRHKLHTSPVLEEDDTSDSCDALILNENLKILNIKVSDLDFEPDDKMFYTNPSFVFESMPVAIPPLFCKGDIVEDVSEFWACRGDKPPLVLESYPLMPDESSCQSGVERSDRTVKGWFQDSDGDILWGYGDDYLNLVRHSPNEREHFLHNVSEYLRGNLSAKILLERHKAFLKTKHPKTMLPELVHRVELHRKTLPQKEYNDEHL